MDPVEIVEHARGTEADRPPLPQISVDPRRIFLKDLPVPEQVPLVIKAMDPHLEPLPFQGLENIETDGVPFGDEIEGGAESQLLFDLHQR
jgi:hypothetical protein